MKKIPTIFERDWNGDRSRVVDKINPAAQWVFDGEGMPTRKLDGTCCMVRGGTLYKRREITEEDLQNGKAPTGFELADHDFETHKVVGWVPVGEGPEDRWYREAFAHGIGWFDGTYELIGPKVQGNPEHSEMHDLVRHDAGGLSITEPFERTFEEIDTFLGHHDIEGIVFHHPDGRMAKIKGRDFGHNRKDKN